MFPTLNYKLINTVFVNYGSEILPYAGFLLLMGAVILIAGLILTGHSLLKEFKNFNKRES